jgi:hypothetical protein
VNALRVNEKMNEHYLQLDENPSSPTFATVPKQIIANAEPTATMTKTREMQWLFLSCSLLIVVSHADAFSIRSLTKKGRYVYHNLSSPPQQKTPFFLTTESSLSENRGLICNKKREERNPLVTLWIQALSGFVAANYIRRTIWPGWLLRLPVEVWNLIHAISNMIFSGSIVTTTILEWNLTNNDSTFFRKLLRVETALVLPALTGSLISGVVLAFHKYVQFKFAPSHVQTALQLLAIFGIWWGLVDRRLQANIEEAMVDSTFDYKMLRGRRITNLVSCGFLLAIYSIKVLKPGLST